MKPPRSRHAAAPLRTAGHRITVAAAIAALAGCAGLAGDARKSGVEAIDTVVVIYAENRAFDTLYGLFPGANGIPGVNPSAVGEVVPQKDFDGSVLPTLPPAWGGLTANGQPVTLTQAQSAGMPNRPFRIDDPAGLNGTGVVVSQQLITRDLVHRYYSNLMQIGDGSNDRFAAYSNAGALSMGYYDGSSMKLWQLAREYTLADNFFMGAFGGSYLNHQYLICACVPIYPDVEHSPAKDSMSEIELDAQGRFVRLKPASSMPASALAGAPRYKHDAQLTPKEPDGSAYTINTMQPPYQPSGAPPAAGGDVRFADPTRPTTLPPQKLATIGDRLDAKGVSWACTPARGAPPAPARPRRAPSSTRARSTSSRTTSRSTTTPHSTRCATATRAAPTCSTSTPASTPMPMPASCRTWRSTSRRAT